MRKCQVCSSDEIEELYEQKFITIENNIQYSYVVGVCKKCGFAFANHLPTQNEYTDYYRQNNKYTYNMAKSGIPEGLKKLHYDGYRIINQYIQEKGKIKSNIRILDVGCATGHFLNVFKLHGYMNVLGVDLNPIYALVAKEEYNIEVITKPLEEIDFNNKFDVIILSGVLEHIQDLPGFLNNISQLLDDTGFLFAEQPDLTMFSENVVEPFLEFSIEHINYFTLKSLQNLYSNFKIQIIYSESKKTYLN